jgi:hypothetical protein
MCAVVVYVYVLGVDRMVHRWRSNQDVRTVYRGHSAWQVVLVVEPVVLSLKSKSIPELCVSCQ